MIKNVIIAGPEGRLEGKYHQGSNDSSPTVLVLHPHPLHGGTMNNKVVYHTFNAFAENQFSVLRFNFRGVGNSLGTFDHGQGELLDATTALDWLQSRHPEASSHWIAGFSFGAWIAMQLIMRRPEINNFIAIAPPVSSYDFHFFASYTTPGLIIQGTEDSISKEDDTRALYENLAEQRDSKIEYITIKGADHFFEERKKELRNIISQFIKPRIVKPERPKKTRRERKRRIRST